MLPEGDWKYIMSNERDEIKIGIENKARCKIVGKYYLCLTDFGICLWERQFNTYKFHHCVKGNKYDYDKIDTVFQLERYFRIKR